MILLKKNWVKKLKPDNAWLQGIKLRINQVAEQPHGKDKKLCQN